MRANETVTEEKDIGRTKQIVFTVIYVLLVAVAVFAILEVGVRLFTKPVYSILQSDQAVGTLHKKNVKDYIWNNEAKKKTLVFTNELGYMGLNDPRDEKQTNEIRIALIGDSFTEGLQVDHFETFPVLLENALNVTDQSEYAFTVYNYGVGGTGTFLQLLRYREHIKPYQMDVVGLIFNHNDFTDNLNKVNYDLDNYQSVADRNVGLRKFILQFALPRYVFTKLQGQRWFLELLSSFGLYELNSNLIELMEHGRESLMDDPEYYDFTFSLIEQMKQEVERSDTTFFVAIKKIEPGYGHDDLHEQNEKLKQFLLDANIDFYETEIDFEQPYGSAGKCLTFNCGGHFTADGHREFAKSLYFKIRDRSVREIYGE